MTALLDGGPSRSTQAATASAEMAGSSRTHAAIRWASRPPFHRAVAKRIAGVYGAEHLPRSGPVVLVANHASYADHFFVETVVDAVRGTPTWFPTKAESFVKPTSRLWHEAWFCYPVDRESPTSEVFERAAAILAAGHVLCLYPEGTRGAGEQLQAFKTGAFRIALAAGAPIVPVGLAGLHRVMPKGSRWLTDQTGAVAFGVPILPATQPEDPRAEVTRLLELTRAQVEHLMLQADEADAQQVADGADGLAALVATVVAERMDEDGRLPRETVRHLTRLTHLALRMNPRSMPARVQAARMAAFTAASSGPLTTPVRAARVTRRTTALARALPEDAFAAYLAGRTNAATPRLLGGSANRAASFYAHAAELDPRWASQAWIGLAESQHKRGNAAGARESLDRAERAIPSDDPRAGLRRNKITALRARLSDPTPPRSDR